MFLYTKSPPMLYVIGGLLFTLSFLYLNKSVNDALILWMKDILSLSYSGLTPNI